MPDLIKYDFIGRFENFQCDFSYVLDRLGVSTELRERARERVNSTVQTSLALAFNRETASWVYETYRDDFVNFGYDQDSWLFDDER